MDKFAELILDVKSQKEKEAKAMLKEFQDNSGLDRDGNFIELCFCLLVANANMAKTKALWESIGKRFLTLSQKQLTRELKSKGYRFYNLRSKFIVEARAKMDEIDHALKTKKGEDLRTWLKDNIKGLGWKESSHFLRNIGYMDYGILDTHVVNVMHRHGLVKEMPKTLGSKKIYFSLEEKLKEVAKTLNISMGELDCYIFYLDYGDLPKK